MAAICGAGIGGCASKITRSANRTTPCSRRVASSSGENWTSFIGSASVDANVALCANGASTRMARRVSAACTGDPWLQIGAQLPDFREQHHVEHLAQVAHAACAASTALEADHAFHCGHMAKTPEPESVFKVGEFLAQLVQVPVVVRVSVHRKPCGLDAVAHFIGLRPVA